ncbi:uncharacterized protein [Salvelinus alpinus]|uniref:uncharacterized protein isoform X1 n=1 Tax=Salvelinus alpinus TaxID=8036 RepID=UPI0039FD6BB3
MCLSIPVLSSLHRPYKRFTPRGRGHPDLVVPARTTHVEFQVSGSLWNCRSAANKAELISAYASLQSLDFLALTETWLTTDNTATPTALSSSAHVFSHTPRASGQRGGGTGILISPKWSFSLSPLTHLSIASFEFHAVTVTSHFKLNILIIYRPPGSLGEFINELDALISSFPEDGSPLTVLGDFNLPTSTFDSFLSASFPLLSSFDLTLSPSPPTHKAGNTLDLIFTRCCSSTNHIATPLQVSDHYLVSFSQSLSSNTSHTAPTRMVSRRPNICSLSPATLCSSILSSLPSAQTFSNLSPDSASSTLLSSLSASFDSLCPLSSRPARSSPPAPWLDDSLRAHRTGLRAAERKWRKTRLPADLASFHSLLSTFSSSVSAAKATFYHSKFQASASNPRKLFATFSSLLNPPPPPPPLLPLCKRLRQPFRKEGRRHIRSSFAKSNDTAGSAHTALPCALTSFSPLSPDEISRLVTAGRPTTCPLDPILSSPDHFRRPSPLPHLAHQLILDRWLRPFRLQESESCTPSEKTYTRSLRCQQLQTSIPSFFSLQNS